MTYAEKIKKMDEAISKLIRVGITPYDIATYIKHYTDTGEMVMSIWDIEDVDTNTDSDTDLLTQEEKVQILRDVLYGGYITEIVNEAISQLVEDKIREKSKFDTTIAKTNQDKEL